MLVVFNQVAKNEIRYAACTIQKPNVKNDYKKYGVVRAAGTVRLSSGTAAGGGKRRGNETGISTAILS